MFKNKRIFDARPFSLLTHLDIKSLIQSTNRLSASFVFPSSMAPQPDRWLRHNITFKLFSM